MTAEEANERNLDTVLKAGVLLGRQIEHYRNESKIVSLVATIAILVVLLLISVAT